jgi:predicted lipoprotein with Yx(FWY)xxD motif
VKKLADAGITVISSTHARGVLPDSHRASLRAFHNSPSVEALIAQCDLRWSPVHACAATKPAHGRWRCRLHGYR